MPTYEYRCDSCGHGFERFQAMSAAPVKTCPECGKRRVRRLIGMGAALIFKGSGFYATDYRSESYKEGAKKDKPESPKADKADTADKDACAGCKKKSDSCPGSKKD